MAKNKPADRSERFKKIGKNINEAKTRSRLSLTLPENTLGPTTDRTLENISLKKGKPAQLKDIFENSSYSDDDMNRFDM